MSLSTPFLPIGYWPFHRGERKSFLKVKIIVDEEAIYQKLATWFPFPPHEYFQQIIQDSYKRLIAP